MADKCQFLKTYSTGNGSVLYCELAAFNQPVNPDFLKKIGCTAEMRKECPGGVELNINSSAPSPAPAPNPPVTPVVSCSPPPELAKTMVGVAEKKANTGMPSLAWLAILAGAYIALGAIMFTIITNDLAAFIGDGLTGWLGISFSRPDPGILAGAELFTGNNLILPVSREKLKAEVLTLVLGFIF